MAYLDNEPRAKQRRRILQDAQRAANEDASRRGLRGWDNRAAAVYARCYWSGLHLAGFCNLAYSILQQSHSSEKLGVQCYVERAA